MIYSENINGKTMWATELSNQRVQICNKKWDIFIHFIIPAMKEIVNSKILEIKL
jgi:hypothetical protein